MNTTNDELIDIFKDLLKETRMNQAILFDSPWGSGKTYFIKEKLIPALEQDISKSGTNYNHVIYISLFGMVTTDEITDAIYSMYVAQYLQTTVEKSSDLLLPKSFNYTKLLNVGSKLATTFLKTKSIDTDSLPRIRELFSPHSVVIFFDDLERSQIPITQVYGYINNLIEHSGVKTVLVANMLNLKDQLEKEQREKLIGITVKYQPNYTEQYEAITTKYFSTGYLGKLLLDLSEWTIHTMSSANHMNLRTLQFAFHSFEKIYSYLSRYKCNDPEIWEEELKNIYRYIVLCAICLRTDKELPNWDRENQNICDVLDVSFKWHSTYLTYPTYHFVNVYLQEYSVSDAEIEETITSRCKVLIDRKRDETITELQAYNKLSHGAHRTLSNEELEKYITQLPLDIRCQYYSFNLFSDILSLLVSFIDIYPKFTTCIESTLEACSSNMLKYIENSTESCDANLLRCNLDIEEKISLYNQYAEPIIAAARKKTPPSQPTSHGIRIWGQEFTHFCRQKPEKKNNGTFSISDTFWVSFYVQRFDIDWLIHRIAGSSIIELRTFNEDFAYLFEVRNIQCDNKIANTLKRILSGVTNISTDNKDYNYIFALEELISLLQKLIDKCRKGTE